jgi:large subunit ribosomal protein L4e
MEVKIRNVKGNTKKDVVTLPEVFNTPYRPDLIKRAVLSEQSENRQPQGRHPLAGKRVAATGVGPGRGIAKIRRTHGKGTSHGSKGAFINSTRGGITFGAPKVEKKIVEKINKKEKFLALKSAVSSTANKELVAKRGHLVEDVKEFPIVLESSVTALNKANEVLTVLENLGLGLDLERCKEKKVRAGKGKMRGRKYRRKIGPLIVVKDDCDLLKAGRNLSGIEIVKVSELDVEVLAPGTNAGRATVWVQDAFDVLQEWN